MAAQDDDPDDDAIENHEMGSPAGRPAVSYRGRVTRGIASAFACGAVLHVPWTLLRPALRPENVAAAAESLFLSVNMLVGYIGGRASARAGLAHDDARAQWTMACTTSVLLWALQVATAKARAALLHSPVLVLPRPLSAVSAAGVMVGFAVALMLVRFGFAMGTYSQAKRDGRVREEEDEASVD